MAEATAAVRTYGSAKCARVAARCGFSRSLVQQALPGGGLLIQRTYTQKGMHCTGQQTRKQPAFSGCTFAYVGVNVLQASLLPHLLSDSFSKYQVHQQSIPKHFDISGQYCSMPCAVLSYAVLCSCAVALTAHHSSCCNAAHAGKQCTCEAHPFSHPSEPSSAHLPAKCTFEAVPGAAASPAALSAAVPYPSELTTPPMLAQTWGAQQTTEQQCGTLIWL
jgi:hypothetical protein